MAQNGREAFDDDLVADLCIEDEVAELVLVDSVFEMVDEGFGSRSGLFLGLQADRSSMDSITSLSFTI